jgi:enoyl-CoA hydratase/carnithine racemase
MEDVVMSYQEIIFEPRAPVAYLTLNMPEKINALSTRMVGEISDALTRLGGDASVKVLILKASGKHFCAGHDLKEMIGKGLLENKRIFENCAKMMQMLHDIPQVVIAQVQGVATAAGCQLAAWSDMIVAAENARFATPGVSIGLFCTTPMVAITRAIGRKAAMEMLMTGRYFPAREAKDLGLVNRVVALADLEAETEQLASQIVSASGFVLGIGKRAFYDQIDQPDAKALGYATRTIVMNLGAEDAQNGIRAFIEKIPPEWKER